MNGISVVCPTFNSSLFIERTLSTVLAQRRPPFELLVSDDGSSDNTVEIVEHYLSERAPEFLWRVLRNPHRGPGATRNAGIHSAKAEWIAFLDSDDLWEENKLEQVTKAIHAHPEANFFSHDELRVDKDGRTSKLKYGERYRSDRPFPPQLYFANVFSTSAVVCRRDLLMVHGGFNETLQSAQDYELWLRLSHSIRPCFVRQTLGRYVLREGNISSGNLLRRFHNELRIAWMHRKIASRSLFFARLARITVSYLRQYVVARLR